MIRTIALFSDANGFLDSTELYRIDFLLNHNFERLNGLNRAECPECST